MYVYDCNEIITTEIKNTSDKEMIRAFISLIEYTKIQGIHPGFHFMDNEESTTLNMKMTTMGIKYQLVPPSNQRAKNSERAIQNFKNHFISGLCSVEKDLNLQLWDRLLKQATISLKLLRQSITLPPISAYTHIYGEFYFNRTPLAPPGTRVVMHKGPNDCA